MNHQIWTEEDEAEDVAVGQRRLQSRTPQYKQVQTNQDQDQDQIRSRGSNQEQIRNKSGSLDVQDTIRKVKWEYVKQELQH